MTNPTCLYCTDSTYKGRFSENQCKLKKIVEQMCTLDAKFKQFQNTQAKWPKANSVSRCKKSKQLTSSDSEDSNTDDVFESYFIESHEIHSMELQSPAIVKDLFPTMCNALTHSHDTSRSKMSFDIVWMLDSGAAYHVIGNLDIISDIQPVNQSPMMDTVGQAHPIKGKDKIFVQLLDGKIKFIDNVLYVSSIHCNYFLLDA